MIAKPELEDEMTKAWQRQIREQRESEDLDLDLFGRWWEGVDMSIASSSVKEINYATAQEIIKKYEWLENMGTTEIAFGLVCSNVVVGAACFGRTGGTNSAAAVFGPKYTDKVMTLCRGACVHYAHEHSASHLISKSCKIMAARDVAYGFLSYADPEAGEIGTVYQACGWTYTGMTSPTEKFKTPSGKVKDARLVSAYTRDRRNGTLTYKRTRAEQKRLMLQQGYEFFSGHAKHRYVGIYGRDQTHTRELKKLLRYEPLDYPKRDRDQERSAGDQSEGAGQCRSLAPSTDPHG